MIKVNEKDPLILFSTLEDYSGSKLKATGITDYTFKYPYTGFPPISYLYISIKNTNSVGDYLWDDLKKIPVDLNEGAGGKWIYLFNSRKLPKNIYDYKFLPLGFIDVVEGRPGPYLDALPGSYLVEGSTTFPDLNDGAGGTYLYLIACKNDPKRFGEPIQDIMIVSSNTSNVSYRGWQKIPTDLNKGAGGKYIYIFYRRKNDPVFY